jgi:hypothetical protein
MGRKIKVDSMAAQLEADPDTVARLAVEKLPAEMLRTEELDPDQPPRLLIDKDGIEILREALIGEELTPKVYQGKVARQAPNRSYVYTHIPELGKVVPTLIPRRYYDTMVGKRILVEAISNDEGTSYRWIKDRTHA